MEAIIVNRELRFLMALTLKLQFLGTGSQKSTIVRASVDACFCLFVAQSIVVTIRNGLKTGEWLFDCGDRISCVLRLFIVTTHQMYRLQREMKSSLSGERIRNLIIRPSRISSIFITHMHGDHIYGLPAFLSDAGISRTQNNQTYAPVEIYGPYGLAKYLKTVFQLTDTKTNCPCIVHELFSDENDPRLDEYASNSTRLHYEDRRIQVAPLFPASDGFWNLCEVEIWEKYEVDDTRKRSSRQNQTHRRLLRLCVHFAATV